MGDTFFPIDHVARGAVCITACFEVRPTTRLRDSHRVGVINVIEGNDGWCRYVSHADMTLRLRRWLHFKIISALLTVFENLSENGDWYSNPDILRLRLRMCIAEILGDLSESEDFDNSCRSQVDTCD